MNRYYEDILALAQPRHSEPYSLRSAVTKLVDAARILLEQHDDDGRGHEQIRAAQQAAIEWLERTPQKPLWFDEDAVPRFVPFHPDHLANIYADEAVLLEVMCQSCEARFDVAMSSSDASRLIRKVRYSLPEGLPLSLREASRRSQLEYGDPPNMRCCPAGPTMSSVPRRVLQYWWRDKPPTGQTSIAEAVRATRWQRDGSVEGGLRCVWWDDVRSEVDHE